MIDRRAARIGDAVAARRAALFAGAAAPACAPEPFSDGDPDAAALLASGAPRLGGETLPLGRLSPFAARAPSAAFRDALHGFDWLDDAAVAALADRAVLLFWARDWMRRYSGGGGRGWRADLAGRRVAALAAASPMLLHNASRAEHRRFRRAIGAHLLFLSARLRRAPGALGRLEAASGLMIGALALGAHGRLFRRGRAALGREAARLIDGRGETASRDPDTLARAFRLLAWTHAALIERDQEPHPAHALALRRAGPALRALRLGPGALARFHGARGAEAAGLDLAFARAGAAARGPRRDAAMGYLRLAAGGTAVLLDAAAPPDTPGGAASALAVEIALGRTLVSGSVGAGGGAAIGGAWAVAARATAAHSALEIDGASAARLSPAGWAARVLGRPLAKPLMRVAAERLDDLDGAWARATHDGYLGRFGLVVSRRLNLSIDGGRLAGEDAVETPDAASRRVFDKVAKAGGLPFFVRFHLAPDIAVEMAPHGPEALLTAANGRRWRFRARGGRLTIAPSVWIPPGANAPLETSQLVIAGRAEAYWGRVSWVFTREPVDVAAAIDAHARASA